MWAIAGGCNALELKRHSRTLAQTRPLSPERRLWCGAGPGLGTRTGSARPHGSNRFRRHGAESPRPASNLELFAQTPSSSASTVIQDALDSVALARHRVRVSIGAGSKMLGREIAAQLRP